MSPRIGVVTFPGTLDEQDALRAVRLAGAEGVSLWYASDSLDGVDAVILPGGSSYGDYPRGGAIAGLSPVMDAVRDFADAGGPVLGVGNGFQVLCEARLLPGALVRNDRQTFVCRDQRLRVDSNDTVWTLDFRTGEEITLALKSASGAFVVDNETLTRIEGDNQVVLRYLDENPNGSINDIAGLTNAKGNVVGLMAHPEHSMEKLTGASEDGRRFFSSVLNYLSARV